MATDADQKPSGFSDTDTIGTLIAIAVLFFIAQRVYVHIRARFITNGIAEHTGGAVSGWFIDHVVAFQIVSSILSAIFLAGIVHTYGRFVRLNKTENELYYPHGVSVTADIDNIHVHNRWKSVMAHADSENSNDWKVAILEADIILDELLDKIGYKGTSVGEKLKQVEPSDFLTLNEAWEAHKIRNAIAHEGSEFLINQREVLRVLGLYKAVFDEFYYI